MTEFPSFPATVYWDPAGNGGSPAWIKIGQTQDLSGPSVSRNSEEVSHRDQTDFIMTYFPGMVDPGEFSFPIVFDPGLTPHGGDGGTSLFESMSVGPCTIPDWKIDMGLCTGSGTAYYLFGGFVTGWNPMTPVQGALTAEVTVKLTNTISFNYSTGGE